MAGTMQGNALGTTEMGSCYWGLSSRLILHNQRKVACVRAQGSLLLAKDREADASCRLKAFLPRNLLNLFLYVDACMSVWVHMCVQVHVHLCMYMYGGAHVYAGAYAPVCI